MQKPETRLFHLHYNVPDPSAAGRALADEGIPLRRRFGRVRDESVALAPGDPEPEGFRFRLRTHQRGYVNITLAPGRRPRFDHLGLCTRAFDEVLARAERAGWPVRDPDGRRPFVTTPWGFRVELHRDGSDVESSLGDWDDAHLDKVTAVVPNPEAVRDGFADVFGRVPGLVVRGADHLGEIGETRRRGTSATERDERTGDARPSAAVPRFRVAGRAFDGGGPNAETDEGRTIDAEAIVGEH
ncbi:MULTISPECIES: VOC family protein [Halorussus]|uniref:VOC family protein n=1 Tax=Halorussus TaxID=1070314 RepID=UPI0020A07744|nr:hypothetical protein [Halorussus vallis]USZ76369.1 hypothetical protein NGM07_03335 [Halorussus vallis]